MDGHRPMVGHLILPTSTTPGQHVRELPSKEEIEDVVAKCQSGQLPTEVGELRDFRSRVIGLLNRFEELIRRQIAVDEAKRVAAMLAECLEKVEGHYNQIITEEQQAKTACS